jgi:protein phosphatase
LSLDDEHMEAIALISDIHGNIPALESVLKDIQRRGIKRIFCLGDLVGKGPEPAEAVDICRNTCEKVVMGNWDSSIADKHRSRPAPEWMQRILDWYRQKVGIDRIDYLKNLPGTIDFLMSGRKVRLLHASPQGVYHRVFHNDTAEKQLAMFENTDFTVNGLTPDIVGYADIHFAYQTAYGNRILFNVGSVGNPLDQPLACYWVLEGNHGSEEPAPFSISVVRLPYDIDLAVKRAYESGMPEIEEWEKELRTAKYRLLKPLSPQAKGINNRISQ